MGEPLRCPGFPACTPTGIFASKSVSRHLTPVRSSRDTRPHGWLLYLGKPLGASLSRMGKDRSGSPSPIARG
ncbi:hypothetical protein [Nostoc sp.]|uniref:hypothetical protein n=1 Tax=Nostoc sp. TaxID=1180 RepID=UPI002FF5AA38